MHIGITGTQEGLFSEQKATLKMTLEVMANCISEESWLHHGDCIGVDEQSHDIAFDLGYSIVVHPPIKADKRAFCKGIKTCIVLPYLERNRKIVDAIEVLIACPLFTVNHPKSKRSGTWYTIKYAHQMQIKTIIVPRDGIINPPVHFMDLDIN